MHKRYRNRSRRNFLNLFVPNGSFDPRRYGALVYSVSRAMRHETKRGRRTAFFVAAIASLLIWYAVALSVTVGEEYRQDALEKRIGAIAASHEELVMQISREQTLKKIGERAASLGFVVATKAAYVALPVSSFAGLDRAAHAQ